MRLWYPFRREVLRLCHELDANFEPAASFDADIDTDWRNGTKPRIVARRLVRYNRDSVVVVLPNRGRRVIRSTKSLS